MDDLRSQERISRDMEARRIARQILGVREDASRQELKDAWRKACKMHHPDRNPGDSDAGARLVAVNCAYRLLAHGETCDMLLEELEARSGTSGHDKYRLDNAWGYFLWWRERYF